MTSVLVCWMIPGGTETFSSNFSVKVVECLAAPKARIRSQTSLQQAGVISTSFRCVFTLQPLEASGGHPLQQHGGQLLIQPLHRGLLESLEPRETDTSLHKQTDILESFF